MALKTLLFSTTVLLVLVTLTRASEIKDITLDNIDLFCPHNSICKNDTSSVGTHPLSGKPCCTDCSCKEDCEKDGNCCFPAPADLTGRECLHPQTEEPNEVYSNVYTFNTYFMVTECPEALGGESCGESNVALWGSMSPVYSKRLGRIYKNQANQNVNLFLFSEQMCAECNGVHDGVLWRADMYCTGYDQWTYQKLSFNDYVSPLAEGRIAEFCQVIFSPPVELATLNDIQIQTCYNDTRRTKCKRLGFNVPENSSMTRDQIISACESSGFRSVTLGFYNVFCVLCNGMTLTSDRTCKGKDVNVNSKFEGLYSFAMLMNPHVYGEFVSNATHMPLAVPTACNVQQFADHFQNNSRSYCRKVMCPTGQLYTIRGKCDYPSHNLRVKHYKITMKLVPLGTVKQSEIETTLRQTLRLSIAKLLKTPLPAIWRVHRLYYVHAGDKINDAQTDTEESFEQSTNQTHQSQNESTFSRSMDRAQNQTVFSRNNTDPDVLWFIAQIYADINYRNALNILKKLKTYISKDGWTIKLIYSTISLRPEFLKYTQLHSRGTKIVSSLYRLDDELTTVDPEITKMMLELENTVSFNTLIYMYVMPRDYIQITQLYYCDQIELYQQEYELYAEKTVLFHKTTGHYYFDGEFILTMNRQRLFVPRICLNGSGYELVVSSGNAPVYMFLFPNTTERLVLQVCIWALILVDVLVQV